MVADRKLFKFLLFLIVLPVGLAIFGIDQAYRIEYLR